MLLAFCRHNLHFLVDVFANATRGCMLRASGDANILLAPASVLPEPVGAHIGSVAVVDDWTGREESVEGSGCRQDRPDQRYEGKRL